MDCTNGDIERKPFPFGKSPSPSPAATHNQLCFRSQIDLQPYRYLLASLNIQCRQKRVNDHKRQFLLKRQEEYRQARQSPLVRMASSHAIEAEGITIFYPFSTPYRYVLRLKDDKLSIWMEDRTSKKQWYKSDMVKSDYVSSTNSITDASPLDYFKYFQGSLGCESANCGDVQRSLEMKLDGTLCLSFAVQLRLLGSTRVAKYSFDLDPLPVERIDTVESKLRDLQEEIERLRQDISTGRALPFGRLDAFSKGVSTRLLLWNPVESVLFTVANGEVLIRQPGVYSITAVVNNSPSGIDHGVELLKNNVCVREAVCYMVNNRCFSTTLSSVLQLDEGDKVSVLCEGTIEGICYLVIAQLGQ